MSYEHKVLGLLVAGVLGAGCFGGDQGVARRTDGVATQGDQDDDQDEGEQNEQADGQPVPVRVSTPPLDNFEDAPRTPDSDDPAIWHPSSSKQRPLVIGTLKNAGLEVYDLSGRVLQTISTAQRPAIAAEDPPAPGVQPEPGTGACADSASGEQFGRFNNVDIAYGVSLRGARGRTRKVDVAVVSDRGCDKLRFFAIDPTAADGPLVDITAEDTPRVFPQRRIQPSPVQSPGALPTTEDNPLDEQDTAYGLDVFGEGRTRQAVVSQEHRNTVAVVDLFSTSSGRMSYAVRARLHLPSVFEVTAADGQSTLAWTPCREDADEDLQVEGIVVDEDHERLYLGQEIVGLWEIDLEDADELVGDIDIDQEDLVEPVTAFGAPFFAVPDDDEFACLEERPEGELPAGTLEGPGVLGAGGEHLVADVEGSAIYRDDDEDALYLLVSSQGSSSFHVYDLDSDEGALAERHLGELVVEGVGSTDGLEVTNRDLGGAFSEGLLVLQNGDAPPAGSTEPVNGFEYDGTSQFIYVAWSDVAASFSPDLDIEP